MAKKTFKQRVNDISSYAQVNKAFRHVHGTPAADLLSSFIYKYDYWKSENRLKKIKLDEDRYVQYFFISKLDLSIDSGISLSALEKNTANNPINKLESLKMIKRIRMKSSNKSDRFVLQERAVFNEIEKASKIHKEDLELLEELPRKYKRQFLKALRSKRDRSQVYNKYKSYIEYEGLDSDELETIEGFLDSMEEEFSQDEEEFSSIEGRSKNSTKNKEKEHLTKNKLTKYDFSNQNADNHIEFERLASSEEITTDNLKQIVKAYMEGNISEVTVFKALVNYLPDKTGASWEMSPQDKEYIIENLKTTDLGYLNAAIEYIETNVNGMASGKRAMRFGSILAGIREKVLEAGIGYIDQRPNMTGEEYKKYLEEEPDEFDFNDIEELL